MAMAATTSAPYMIPVSTSTSTSLPDLGDDLGQQVERDRRPIELAPTVIGEHDAVDAEVGHRARVGEGLNALDHELAGPLRT